jgi:CBS domain-containing protein
MMVKDVMTPGVVTVERDASMAEVVELMAARDISGVAVLEKDGDLAGTVSDTDVLRAVGRGSDLKRLRAEDVMTPCTITASPEMSIQEVAGLMVSQGVHRLFVSVDEELRPRRVGPRFRERLVGVVSTRDLVKSVMEAAR